MQNEKATIGIVGLGSFGAFVAGLIAGKARVIGYDADVTKRVSGVENVDFSQLANADSIVLAVPLEVLPLMLEKLKAILQPSMLLVDVCSVKVKPEGLYASILPKHTNLLLTHPLFGPQSAATGTNGHRLIVTKSSGIAAERAVVFCRQVLGLDVQVMTAKEHDEIMARVHALTFFVARALGNMGLKDEVFMTPSYAMLMDLVALDKSHSEELFQTVENGNPFAAQERALLLKSFAEIEANLE